MLSSKSSSSKKKITIKRKRTVSFNKSGKNKPKLVNLITDDEELQILKSQFRRYPELRNDLNTIRLIIAIKSLNGTNPHNTLLTEREKYITLNLIKKIKVLLESHRFLFFYFLYYKIEEKHIMKIIPFLRYEFVEKDDILFKEGEMATKFYWLIKGKISFRKKYILINEFNETVTKEIERNFAENGSHFCEMDIIHERKQKTTAYCTENCHLIYLDKDTFRHYLEDKYVKVENDVKAFLKNFFSSYMTLPAIKIERFIQTSVELNFYRREEIIYVEGEDNYYLYMIYNGEADLLKKISNGEFSVLPIFQYSKEYIKNNARGIYYGEIVKNIKKTEIKKKSQPINNCNNNDPNDKIINQSKLDILLNKNSYQVISTLNKGFLGGMEISAGIAKTKYSLITSSEFTSVFKINLKNLDDEHLSEFMLNILPVFIDSERIIHSHIKKVKYIDSNVVPEACQKYSRKYTKGNFLFTDEENDKVYRKCIQNIDEKFDVNEGGFIKVNDFNMKLQKKKNTFKELLKENLIKDKKTNLFLKSFVAEQNSKLKFRGVKINKPYIPSIVKTENGVNENTLSLPEFPRFENNKKVKDIYCLVHNSKIFYYTNSSNDLLQKLKNRCISSKKKANISKKSQEMFDKLLPAFKRNMLLKEIQAQKKIKSLSNIADDTTKGIYFEFNFNDMKQYMRNLIVKKSVSNNLIYNDDPKNSFYFSKKKRANHFAKSTEISNIRTYLGTDDNSKTKNKFKFKSVNKPKKLTFYNTGKYDIPLFTKIKD